MRKDHFMRFAGVSRRTLVVVAALMMPLTSLGIALPALAKEPTGDYAVFNQCPRFTAGVQVCVYSQITGGEMTLNKLTVPLVNPTPLQFGATNWGSEEEEVVGALGETLSATPQPVPGGLSALIDCNEIKGKGWLERYRRRACKTVFENPRFAAVNEATELAAPVSSIGLNSNNNVNQVGVTLSLPVKVHLENPLLGKRCYIGSNADPIVFELTTGTTSPPEPNKPLRGKIGDLELKDELQIIELTEHTELDNAFAVPQATGCGGPFSFLIDPLINNRVGLPSPAGYNTIIHSGYSFTGTAEAVIASEVESKPSEKEHEKKWNKEADPGRWWRH
jgi:hypothetical protein